MRRIHQKSDMATKGFFYLDHVPTGKVFTGTSDNMQQDILDIKALLESGKHKNKSLRALYEKEPDFTAKCVPTKGIREAKKLEKEFRAERPPFLLIN